MATGQTTFTQPLGTVLAGKALESARVNEIFVDRQGCSEEIEANAYAVRVAVQRGLGEGRVDGDTKAYGESIIPEADEKTINLKNIWDNNVDLPKTITAASPVEMYESTVRNIGRSVANFSNKVAMTEILTSATKPAGLQAALVSDKATAEVAGLILKALAQLEEGDSSKNIYRFETEDAVIVVTPDVYAHLLNSNLLVYKDIVELEGNTNYKGLFNGSTKLFVLPKAMCGNKDTIAVVAPNAFAKGSGPAEELKVIDNPNGQGLRLQPLYRFGYEIANDKGVIVYQSDK